MKRYIALIILLLSVAAALAYPVRIASWEIDADVKRLNELGVSVHTVTRSSGTIVVYVRDDGEFQMLLAQGFDAIALPDEAKEYARKLSQIKSLDPPQNEYYTLDQYHQFMIQTAAQYPDICALVQVGTSIQNRPLYFLKISDNVNVPEGEPKFKYISSIHGNEVVGYDMCIRLIQLLASEYGTNTRITNLVNGTEIWICPMMNPDGYVLGQRYNAAGVDLNRNFPMPTGNQHPDGHNWQPETTAIMDFGNAHNFILSANFHGGALVMNYPWDYTYVLAPDDALLQAAALTYSIHNPPMYNSTEFPQGITNGAAWYVITGSMQDWNYGYTDCMDITAEIGNNMWPPASQLPTFWAQNQESMLSYMEFVHRGVHGLVTNSAGAPLAATITVAGNAKVMHSDPVVGDYHRLLLPGTWSITAEAQGYLPQTAQIIVPDLGSTTHNFVLETAQAITFSGQLRSVDGLGISGAQVTLNTIPATTGITDANGCFVFDGVLEGNYQISFTSGQSPTQTVSFLLTQGENRQVFIFAEPVSVFSDTFDSIANWTATSPWGITTYLGESVLTDSPAGNYANNINKSVRLTNPVSLQNIADPMITFRARYALEAGYDFVYLEASTNAATWTQIASFTGSQADWETYTYSLESYAGQSVYVRFRIRTDYSVTQDGIYIDDLVISGIDAATVFYGDADGNRRITKGDAKAILDYANGLDALPEIDPLPWDEGRIEACDVDLDDQVSELDAYLVFKYLLDPSFRFEAQSGEEADFPPVTLSHEGYGQSHVFQISPANDVNCYSLQFLPLSGVDIYNYGVTPLGSIHSVNYDQNRISWIRGADPCAGLIVWLGSDQPSITCDYRLNGIAGTLVISSGSAADDADAPQPVFSLAQNHPNPFNPSTRISFSLSDASARTILSVYNARGQLIRSLVDELLPVGSHSRVWDGKDNAGQSVGSGIYLYRLSNGNQLQTRKMLLLK